MLRTALQTLTRESRRVDLVDRQLSVLAWGRNTEGQCGVENKPVLLEPALLKTLQTADVQTVSAGKQHSAAVLKTGEVCTWGCGKAGKLGHGSSDNLSEPTRVEALIGRGDITSAALGSQHTLFLDSKGTVFSCGENKEGQCGYGTSIDVLAQQRRQEWAIGANIGRIASSMSTSSVGMDGQGNSSEHHASQKSQQSAWFSGLALKPFIERGARQAEIEEANRLFELSRHERAKSHQSASSSYGGAAQDHSKPAWDAAFFGPSGLLPGQTHTPTRIGRDLHELVAQSNQQTLPGIEGEVVRAVAASRYFSILATATGEIWSFGGGFNGELGFRNTSWVTSAQKVEGQLAQALQESGGAIALAAGGTFCLALTAMGKVIVWGKIGGPAGQRGARPAVAEIMGLPPITSIAAGQSHALMTDGERVWALGRWLDADGSKQVGSAFEAPAEVLRLPQGVKSVSAGLHSSAAVSRDGQLWIWGKVISKEHAKSLREQHSAWRSAKTAAPQSEIAWTGLGSDLPAQVEGLRNVRSISLGGVHALAVVDDE
ncbi:hypothetical protein ABBQ38_013312 [Trebouxia sp. C0009 RCD-2024]